MKDHLYLIAGNASDELAQEVAEELKVDLKKSRLATFADGEISLNLEASVMGQDAVIIQSTSAPVNDHLMELLLLQDACRRGGARSVTVVMPYFGYARQDRPMKTGDPISAKLVANLITTAGLDRLIAIELHSEGLLGFFDVPVVHLRGQSILSPYYKNMKFSPQTAVVVSPDIGAVKRSRALAGELDLPLAIIDKSRPQPNKAKVEAIIGDVSGKVCLILDDLIDTGGTIMNAAKSLKEAGAKAVTVAASHGVLSKGAVKKLSESVVDEVVLLDTIESVRGITDEKFTTLSCAKLLAQAIKASLKP